MSPRHMPRWMRAVRDAVRAQPGITELPRCDACHRLMAPVDMRDSGLCVDCHVERDEAFGDDGPFLPDDLDP
jgi:hypothetical protein